MGEGGGGSSEEEGEGKELLLAKVSERGGE